MCCVVLRCVVFLRVSEKWLSAFTASDFGLRSDCRLLRSDCSWLGCDWEVTCSWWQSKCSALRSGWSWLWLRLADERLCMWDVTVVTLAWTASSMRCDWRLSETYFFQLLPQSNNYMRKPYVPTQVAQSLLQHESLTTTTQITHYHKTNTLPLAGMSIKAYCVDWRSQSVTSHYTELCISKVFSFGKTRLCVWRRSLRHVLAGVLRMPVHWVNTTCYDDSGLYQWTVITFRLALRPLRVCVRVCVYVCVCVCVCGYLRAS